jgi:hypothetical protein
MQRAFADTKLLCLGGCYGQNSDSHLTVIMPLLSIRYIPAFPFPATVAQTMFALKSSPRFLNVLYFLIICVSASCITMSKSFSVGGLLLLHASLVRSTKISLRIEMACLRIATSPDPASRAISISGDPGSQIGSIL